MLFRWILFSCCARLSRVRARPHACSYEGHGKAMVQCVGNCTCPDTTLDSYWERHASLQQMHAFQVGISTCGHWAASRCCWAGLVIRCDLHLVMCVTILLYLLASTWLLCRRWGPCVRLSRPLPPPPPPGQMIPPLTTPHPANYPTTPAHALHQISPCRCSQVSQHSDCRVRVTVLPETSAPDGGHKVKLLFSIIAPSGSIAVFDKFAEQVIGAMPTSCLSLHSASVGCCQAAGRLCPPGGSTVPLQQVPPNAERRAPLRPLTGLFHLWRRRWRS